MKRCDKEKKWEGRERRGRGRRKGEMTEIEGKVMADGYLDRKH